MVDFFFRRIQVMMISFVLIAGSLAYGNPEPLSADSGISDTDGNEMEVVSEGNVEERVNPLWMDTYGESVYSEHEAQNLAGFSEFKIGKRIPIGMPIDLYAKMRIYRDKQNYYWNNRADGGLGARIPLLKKLSLSLFGEIVSGQYLHLSTGTLTLDHLQGRIEQNRGVIDAAQKEFQAMYQEIFKANLLDDNTFNRQTLRNLDTAGSVHLKTLVKLNAQLDSLETAKDSLVQVMDSVALVPAGSILEYRGGLLFWYGWGTTSEEEKKNGPWISFPFRFWGDIYSDCIFSSMSRHVLTRGGGVNYHDSLAIFRNLIYYANPNVGLMIAEGKIGSIAAYAAAYVTFDSHKDWWNNVALIGPGIRYVPFQHLDFILKGEYLAGRYYGRQRKDELLPYPRYFRDLRVTASCWYGLGV